MTIRKLIFAYEQDWKIFHEEKIYLCNNWTLRLFRLNPKIYALKPLYFKAIKILSEPYLLLTLVGLGILTQIIMDNYFDFIAFLMP